MPIVSQATPGDFVADGVIIEEQFARPAAPIGVATGRIGFAGKSNWGKPGVPLYVDPNGILAAIGTETQSQHSMARAALDAVAEGATDLVFARVTSGDEVAATLNLMDTNGAPAILLEGTAVCGGDLPNGAAFIRCDLTAGSEVAGAGASPLYRLTVGFPNNRSLTYENIIGYAALAGGFDAPTFKINALAALNGTDGVHAPNPWFTFAAGVGTHAPHNATVFTAAGGANGTDPTEAEIFGADGYPRTGIHALRSTGCGQFVLCGVLDPTLGAPLAAFTQEEGAKTGHIGFPLGTTPDQAIAIKQANNLYQRFLSPDANWGIVKDEVSGKTLTVPPMGKIAGIMAVLRSDQSPSNKPKQGISGWSGTEWGLGQPLSKDDRGRLKTNGIQYVSNQMPRGGNLLGLSHGRSGDGITPFIDVAVAQEIASTLDSGPILGQFVGDSQTTDAGDDTRTDARATLKAYMQGWLYPKRRITGYDLVLDNTNNSDVTESEGLLIGLLKIKTSPGIEFVYQMLQVGSTVQLSSQAVTA